LSSSKVRKTLDRLAYASLVLDICIAVITTFSLLGRTETQYLLVPINYLLTLVVVLSVIMFVVLLLLKSKEKQASGGR
jgi:ABC-type transport system involved in multi-copper enzyme maturation permease subunit